MNAVQAQAIINAAMGVLTTALNTAIGAIKFTSAEFSRSAAGAEGGDVTLARWKAAPLAVLLHDGHNRRPVRATLTASAASICNPGQQLVMLRDRTEA